MWKSLSTGLGRVLLQTRPILAPENVLQQSLRTTFVLKRRYPVRLHRKNGPQKKLQSRHYVYDLIKHEDTQKKENIDVILTSYVDGLGHAGDIVNVRPENAYKNLLLPGLAVYASPLNLKKFEGFQKDQVGVQHSSATSALTVKTLSQVLLSVVMNLESPWVLQPWHVKTSFRKSGYVVPEEAIELPEEQIKGPDLNLENKEFFVTVTINNLEKVKVRCRIHHWSTEIKERLPYVEEFWKEKSEAIFEDHQKILNEMPTKRIRVKQSKV